MKQQVKQLFIAAIAAMSVLTGAMPALAQSNAGTTANGPAQLRVEPPPQLRRQSTASPNNLANAGQQRSAAPTIQRVPLEELEQMVPNFEPAVPSASEILSQPSDIPMNAPMDLNQQTAAVVEQTGPQTVTILLDSVAAPRHAYFYIAQEMGLFTQYGLEVRLIAGADLEMASQLIRAGSVDLALMTGPELALQVRRAEPLAPIASLMTSPTAAVYMAIDPEATEPKRLQGSKIGLQAGLIPPRVLPVVLGANGVSLDQVQIVELEGNGIAQLKSGEVDAIVANRRTHFEAQAALNGIALQAIYPEESGIMLYDGLLMAGRSDKALSPKVQKLVLALDIAAQFAVNHPLQAWQLFVANRDQLNNGQTATIWQYTLPRLNRAPSAVSQLRLQGASELLQIQPIQ